MKRDRSTKLILTALITVVFLIGCEREDEIRDMERTPAVPLANAAELIADSVFLYAQTVYLWNDLLPAYAAFNPRQYVSTDQLAGMTQELLAIADYAINPETGQSYEFYAQNTGAPKYSYVDNPGNNGSLANVAGRQALVDMDGQANDLGLLVGAYGSSNSDYTLYVQAVFKGSPAGRAGIKRGDRITHINGRGLGSNFNAEYPTIDEAFYTDGAPVQVILEGIRTDGTRFSETLSKESYRPSVVLCDSVYRAAGRSIGYVALYQFNDLENLGTELDRVFNRFSAAGVDGLIVDLRYNGGGYVATAEYMANLIAPATLTGRTMFSERFNESMQQGRVDILKNQPVSGTRYTYADYDYSEAANTYTFTKNGGPASVSSVVFIVTGETASASELLINSLAPHMDVKLVGATTFGKPVGFFPLKIGEYEIYSVCLKRPILKVLRTTTPEWFPTMRNMMIRVMVSGTCRKPVSRQPMAI